MRGVEFHEEMETMKELRPSWLSRLIMSIGLAKTQSGAQQVLLFVAVLALLTAGYFFFSLAPRTPDVVPGPVVLNLH